MRDGLGDLHPSRAISRRMLELETELKRARSYQRRHSKSPETLGRWGLDQPPAPQQEEGWFITYLDMMTLLLVVMIVMLAFSGNLGERAGTVKPEENIPASVAALDISAAPDAQRTAAEDVGEPDTTPPATPPAAPPTAPESAGNGLLPGGTGLLPGNGGMADAAAVSEPLPGWTATWAIPFPDGHPADIGPLPRDAQVIATAPPSTPVQLPPEVSSNELYPGWSAADLAASFIGPRRPASSSGGSSDAPVDADTASTTTLAATPMAEEDSPEDMPSEGETMAAGLSLGELGNDVEVLVNERSVSFRVNSEILFDTSQADLSRSGLSVLRRIVRVLSDTPHEITVEGHTDSVPVRRNVRYPSNWELSSARAGSVVRYLQANGIDRSRLKAVGYADTRPIADNHTPAGRASNRRVELLLEKRN